MDKDIVILGAGIAGISAGYFLTEEQPIIYESSKTYGGLCNSFFIKGFTFDNAIHMSFTNTKECREIFDKTDYFMQKPNPYNYYYGTWLKHPVQNNLFNLPINEKITAIKDFINKPEMRKNFNNYEEWLISNYGNYIAEKFPMVYTRKYWTIEAKRLGTSWIDRRMHKPSLEELLYGAMDEDTNNVYYAKEMRYPQKGGFKKFLSPMAEKINIKYNKKAILIDTDKKFIGFDDGTKTYYSTLVSSIPLPEIIRIIKDVPHDVQNASNNLLYTSVALISVGFKKIINTKSTWIYIYDEDIPAARAYFPHLKSINNSPNGCSSIQFEVYYSKYKKLNMDDESLKKCILNSIIKMNLATDKDVVFMELKKIEYANVIFENNIYENRQIVKKFLKEKDIISIGRFGEWDYFWSDQSFMSGKNAADKIKMENYKI